MDADFINEYVKKQRAWIDDMQSRLLLSETKLAITENSLKIAIQQLEQTKKELIDALAQVKQLTHCVDSMKSQAKKVSKKEPTVTVIDEKKEDF